MHIYFKNNLAKFHPYPIRNDVALSLFWRGRPQQEQQQQQLAYAAAYVLAYLTSR